MIKIKLYRIIITTFIAFIVVGAMMGMSLSECKTADFSLSDMGADFQGIVDLDELDLWQIKEGLPSPRLHTASQMSGVIDVMNECSSDSCPNNCNAYEYTRYHYGEFNIPYTIDQSAINEGIEDLIVQAVLSI